MSKLLPIPGCPEYTWIGSPINPQGKADGDRGIYWVPVNYSKSENGGKQEKNWEVQSIIYSHVTCICPCHTWNWGACPYSPDCLDTHLCPTEERKVTAVELEPLIEVTTGNTAKERVWQQWGQLEGSCAHCLLLSLWHRLRPQASSTSSYCHGENLELPCRSTRKETRFQCTSFYCGSPVGPAGKWMNLWCPLNRVSVDVACLLCTSSATQVP